MAVIRVLPLALAAALAVAGAALFGQGAWMGGKAWLAQRLLDQAWERTLASGSAEKAWPWADAWPVARLHAPRLDRSAVVLSEASGEAMAFGPAHVAQTPRPGQPGVSVIAAHRDTHFAFLKNLKPGDLIEVETSEGVQRFSVTGADIVHHQASGIQTEGGPARLALVTCYPFEALRPGPLRYVVYAQSI